MLKAPSFWYQNKITISAILLLPISLLWVIGTYFKKKFSKVLRSKIPVIAVGSAIVGGNSAVWALKPKILKTLLHYLAEA